MVKCLCIIPALLLIRVTAFAFLQPTRMQDTVFIVMLHTPVNDIKITKGTEKILLVRVDEKGKVIVGIDTMTTDLLAPYIQERLFKSFMGTGKMQGSIKIEKITPAVPEPVLDLVTKKIKEGQQRALTDICLQKYKNRYDSLVSKKQDKLKKQFPVLFQENFQ